MIHGSPHLLSGLVDKLEIEGHMLGLHGSRVVMIWSKLAAGKILRISRSATQAG
jgi:hypothetical protein